MGIYVYALNSNVRTVSGVTLGVAEYRYKEWGGFGGARENDRLWNRYCKRRVMYFRKNPTLLPRFMVLSKLEENREVYVCEGSVTTGDECKKVGTLKKVGRGWAIVWNDGFDPSMFPAHTAPDDDF